MKRYFRTSDAELYDAIRLQLDAAWGHPTADGRTLTCVCPAESAPRDEAGRILLAVSREFAEFPAAAVALLPLLASGAVEEITQAEYQPVVDPPPA
jgi:hypothetical protein